jgi:hypothetical protein
MKKLLELAQSQAAYIDGSPAKNDPEENRGMGMVTLLYNAYEGVWAAKADWSDSSSIERRDEDAEKAVYELIHALIEERVNIARKVS